MSGGRISRAVAMKVTFSLRLPPLLRRALRLPCADREVAWHTPRRHNRVPPQPSAPRSRRTCRTAVTRGGWKYFVGAL